MQTACLKKEDLCIPYRIYNHLHISSTSLNQIKSPLAIMRINNTCWMIRLALYHTAILVCCKNLRNLSINFDHFFKNFCSKFEFLRNFYETWNKNEETLLKEMFLSYFKLLINFAKFQSTLPLIEKNNNNNNS